MTGTLEDIFDLQDEITSEITTALQVELTEGEQARIWRRRTKSLTAWDLFLRAQFHFRQFAQVSNRLARENLAEALQVDPDFSAAWALLAWTHVADARLAWTGSAQNAIKLGIDAAENSIAANADESDGYAMMARLQLIQRHYDEAEEAVIKAVDLAPSAADHHVAYGFVLNMIDRPMEALAQIQLGMRLSPYYPEWYLGFLGMSYRLLGRTDDAIAADLKRLERSPNNGFSDVRLAAAYAELGDIERARHYIGETRQKLPNYRLFHVSQTDPYKNSKVMDHYVELLRKAGMPE